MRCFQGAMGFGNSATCRTCPETLTGCGRCCLRRMTLVPSGHSVHHSLAVVWCSIVALYLQPGVCSSCAIAEGTGNATLHSIREPLIWRVFFGVCCGICPSWLRRSVFGGPEAANARFRGETAAGSAPAGPVRQIPDTLLPCHCKCGWAIIRFEKPGSSASRCTFLSKPR